MNAHKVSYIRLEEETVIFFVCLFGQMSLETDQDIKKILLMYVEN